MRRVSYQILFSAMLVLPLLSVAQTFNHVYPSGGDRLGIFAEPANGGYRMVANASPVEQVVRFIGIQTDAIGVQLAADTLEFNNTGANGGRYNRLSDGSFAITSPTGSNDMYLGKVAPDGTVIWIQQYELPYFNDVSSGVVVEGNGGELFIYGYMSDWFTQYGQFYLIKAAADGQELWVKTFSAYGNNETYLPNVEGGAATADGGFLMVAVSIQNQNKFLYHFDTNGNEQVVTSFGSFNDNPTLVVEGNPGKAVFSYSISTGSFSTYNTAAMLAQYDLPSGQMDWELQLEPFDTPTWPQQSFITALSKTSDGGFLVAGYGSATGHAARLFLAKIDGMFQIVWNKHDYGFLAEASFVQAAPTGGILVAGRRDGLAWLMLMD
ncbi:MAG: hypothetical protein HY842_14555, partial [Bacteroidetes bacterium]|nr:hypothetical protein [Bacteroidota bacterium]